MPIQLLSPLMWQTIPFDLEEAWADFLLFHHLWHGELAKTTKTAWWPTDDLRTNLLPHAMMHQAIDRALGVATAYDLLSYNLHDRDSFAGFHLLHSLLHQSERQAAGL